MPCQVERGDGGAVRGQSSPAQSSADEARRSRYGQGFCRQPIRLRSVCDHHGEVRPEERLLVACGNRRKSQCPYCSDVYEGDAWAVANSGWRERSPYLWVTLTAPSFGPVHEAAKKRVDRGLDPTCRCGRLHAADDPAISTPLDPATYDYTGQARWNMCASELFAETVADLRYAMRRAGQRRLPRLHYLKCWEFQARGALHGHVMIRGWGLSEKKLREVVAQAKAGGCRWGVQMTVERIAPGNMERARKRFSYLSKYATKAAADDVTAARAERAQHYARLQQAVRELLPELSPCVAEEELFCATCQDRRSQLAGCDCCYGETLPDGTTEWVPEAMCEPCSAITREVDTCGCADAAKRRLREPKATPGGASAEAKERAQLLLGDLAGQDDPPATNAPTRPERGYACGRPDCRRCASRLANLGSAAHVLSKSQTWGKTFGRCRAERREWGAQHGESGDELAGRMWLWAGAGYRREDAARALAALLYERERGRPPTVASGPEADSAVKR